MLSIPPHSYPCFASLSSFFGVTSTFFSPANTSRWVQPIGQFDGVPTRIQSMVECTAPCSWKQQPFTSAGLYCKLPYRGRCDVAAPNVLYFKSDGDHFVRHAVGGSFSFFPPFLSFSTRMSLHFCVSVRSQRMIPLPPLCPNSESSQ